MRLHKHIDSYSWLQVVLVSAVTHAKSEGHYKPVYDLANFGPRWTKAPSIDQNGNWQKWKRDMPIFTEIGLYGLRIWCFSPHCTQVPALQAGACDDVTQLSCNFSFQALEQLPSTSYTHCTSCGTDCCKDNVPFRSFIHTTVGWGMGSTCNFSRRENTNFRLARFPV